jgi:hypothetical protein
MLAAVVLASLGVLVVSLDSSLNIALPAVAAYFGISPEGQLAWVSKIEQDRGVVGETGGAA